MSAIYRVFCVRLLIVLFAGILFRLLHLIMACLIWPGGGFDAGRISFDHYFPGVLFLANQGIEAAGLELPVLQIAGKLAKAGGDGCAFGQGLEPFLAGWIEAEHLDLEKRIVLFHLFFRDLEQDHHAGSLNAGF